MKIQIRACLKDYKPTHSNKNKQLGF
ncbi:hypothetical protein METHPM2_1240012 [Pseudomonas sp. PM2]